MHLRGRPISFTRSDFMAGSDFTRELRRALAAACTLLATLPSAPAHAQDSLSIELRGGTAFPVDDLGRNPIDRGYWAEGTAAYVLYSPVWAYFGWGLSSFGADRALGVDDVDVDEGGFVLGLRYERPLLGLSDAGPMVRLQLGTSYGRITFEDADDDLIAETGSEFGWEAGAGVHVPLGEQWRIAPELRYRSFSPEVAHEGDEQEIALRYVSLGVALLLRF